MATPSTYSADHREILEHGPVLLYDGECGVCAASIQWILAHERSNHLRFAAQQSEWGRQLRARAGIPDEVDSLIWVELEGQRERSVRTRIWSDAVLSVVRYVGGPWKLLAILRWVPAPLRNLAYRLFASRRRAFMPVSCLLPSPQERTRFIDS